jgi:antitoxin component YwqK of YwqJK toxin-antitoxin module
MMRVINIFLSGVIILIIACKSHNTSQNSEVNEGIAKEYYSNGTIKSETESRNGKANGLMKNYNSDGDLISVYTFKDGIRQGPAVSYYPGGELNLKMYYNNGLRDGITLWYYKTGELFREIPYKEGKVDGIKKSYYQDGKLMAEAPYLNDYPGVELKEYNNKGKLLVDNTRIIIKEINHLPAERRITLELRLSELHPGTSFYQGELTENKYLNRELWPLPFEDGKSTYVITVPSSGVLNETYSFSASYQTKSSNIRVVSRKYKISIGNK